MCVMLEKMNYLRAVQPAGLGSVGQARRRNNDAAGATLSYDESIEQYNNNKRWLDHSEVDCYAFAEEVTSEPLLALLH